MKNFWKEAFAVFTNHSGLTSLKNTPFENSFTLWIEYSSINELLETSVYVEISVHVDQKKRFEQVNEKNIS